VTLAIAAGHPGIIFPSTAHPGGTNVVLFLAELEGKGRIEVNDPSGALPKNDASWR